MRYWGLSLVFVALLATPADAGGLPGFCEEPNMLILLDYSGSMNENDKWGQATRAIDSLTELFERQVRFGLMLFPWRGRCRVEQNEAIQTSCGPDNHRNITAAIGRAGNPPDSHLTPIGSAISQGASYLNNLPDRDRRRLMILVTDGIERCGGNGAQAAGNALQNDIRTFVIGFGAGVREGDLTRIAQAGGTNDYYRVGNENALLDAFEEIIDEVSVEICDGLDNDCDGLVDEEVDDRNCDTECGQGIQRCLDGNWSICFGGNIPEEDCDGIDDDCDGEIDESVTLPCVTLSGNPGFLECIEGIPAEDCTPEDPDREEVCDNIDNDMDGLVDENTDQECQVDCHMGRRLCIEGAYIGCTAQPASEEVCDGIDNDCDDLIDEMSPCAETEICGEEGVCLRPCLAGECPDGFLCIEGYCRPIPCDPPCVDGAVCREQACYLECTIDRDCPERFVCRGGLCAVDIEMSMPDAGPNPSPTDGGPANPFEPPTNFDMGVAETTDGSDVTGCHCDANTDAGLPWIFLVGLLGLGRFRRRVEPTRSEPDQGRDRPEA